MNVLVRRMRRASWRFADIIPWGRNDRVMKYEFDVT